MLYAKNFKLVAKKKLKFPVVNTRSFSSLKLKELTKKPLNFRFTRPDRHSKVIIRNFHGDPTSWSGRIDNLIYDMPPSFPAFIIPVSIGISSGLGHIIYNVVEDSTPLSNVAPSSYCVMLITTVVACVLIDFWPVV